jgi:hypothetical protein
MAQRSRYRAALGSNTTTNRERLRQAIALVVEEEGARRGFLLCTKGLRWQTALDPRSVDNAGVADPKCPTCGEFYADLRLIDAVYDASVKCDAKCVKALEYKCVCSCGGLNHGIGEAMMAVE